MRKKLLKFRFYAVNLLKLKNWVDMKQIIVPIDFSDESINGLKLAIVFANRYGSTIQMVHVQRFPTDQIPSRFAEQKAIAEEKLLDLVQKFTPMLANGAQITSIVKKGKIFQEVVDQAEAFENSTIICSTHGASGFEEYFLGSNAFRILTATSCPVVTVRHGAMHGDVKKIVLPIDISSETRQKVPYTAEIAQIFNAEVHVIGVASLQTDDIDTKLNNYVKLVCDYFSKRNIKTQTAQLRGGNITNLAIDYTLNVNADLISIMSDQGMDFADFVLGSYAQQMLSKSPVPVLCITPKDLALTSGFRTQG